MRRRRLCAVVITGLFSSLADAQTPGEPRPEAFDDLKRPQTEVPAPVEKATPAPPAAVAAQPTGPSSLPQRAFGIGTAGGGGLVGLAGLGSPGILGPPASVLGVTAQPPTLELRFFLGESPSLDISVPLGSTLVTLFRGAGFSFGSDVYLNFNPRVSSGVRLMVGPGLSVRAGYSTTLGFTSAPAVGAPYGSQAPFIAMGAVNAAMEVGAEFLTERMGLGVAFLLRPTVGLLFADVGSQTATFFSGGFTALASLTFYGQRN